MPEITIYTTKSCPYCHRAKALLRDKQVIFTEIDVSFDIAKRTQMRNRARGRHTVPQIFIGDHHIGGCDDLHDLERNGTLDRLLVEQEND